MTTMDPSLNGINISVAMPIFNESDGIAETLTSIDAAFRHSGATVTICVQNDVSTDNTLEVLIFNSTLQLKRTNSIWDMVPQRLPRTNAQLTPAVQL